MSSWGRSIVLKKPTLSVPQSKVISNVSIDDSKSFVSVRLCGGLGNRFFQILVGLGYAARTGREFILYEQYIDPNSHMNLRYTHDVLFAVFPDLRIYRGQVKWTHYHEILAEHGAPIPDLQGSVLLEGYFQDEKYFMTGARAAFSIPCPPNPTMDISGFDFSKMYFVHFRNGDYLASDFNVGLDNYYKNCVWLLKGTDTFMDDSKFLICSDQPELVHVENYGLTHSECIFVPANAGAWLTLHLMNLCKGGICANSTFSWFGAFGIKGNGPIYMPKKWNNTFDWIPEQSGWATIVDI